MLSLNFAKKLWQVPLLGGLGLFLGMQSASAISLTGAHFKVGGGLKQSEGRENQTDY